MFCLGLRRVVLCRADPPPQAFEDGMSKEELFELTNIDPWWLAQMEELHTTGV